MRYIIILMTAIMCITTSFAQKHQHGKASFYSKRATGARSASGQKIHHDSLTCAHRFYPFGTHLKVTNLSNNKSVIVKVIDRGPYGRGRLIDLSWAAANKIGMISQGIATVKIEMVDKPVPYRLEESQLPKIDFEIAEFEPKNTQEFSTSKRKQETSAKKKAEENQNSEKTQEKKEKIQEKKEKIQDAKHRKSTEAPLDEEGQKSSTANSIHKDTHNHITNKGKTPK